MALERPDPDRHVIANCIAFCKELKYCKENLKNGAKKNGAKKNGVRDQSPQPRSSAPKTEVLNESGTLSGERRLRRPLVN